ncbi:MAG: hypothetical protein KTR31_32135 [Myxococcales bacterium]|nr:hypothetical protein [Myxococcales bacterium]
MTLLLLLPPLDAFAQPGPLDLLDLVQTTPISCADLPNKGQAGGMDLWPLVFETRDPAVAGEAREIWYAIADGVPTDFAEDIRTAGPTSWGRHCMRAWMCDS